VTENNWPTIAVVGAGAVGCYFGGMLARAGAPVTLIGRPRHIAAIGESGLLLETNQFQQRLRISASTDVAATRDAQLVLFCVKTRDTESAAQSLASYLTSGAIVVSLQNGVDNVDRIRATTGIHAIPAVVYVAAEMLAPGHVKHNARGDLVIGLPHRRSETKTTLSIESIAALFARAGVPCRVSDNIEGELWTKLIMNSAYNAISALGHAKYGSIVRDPDSRDVIRRIVEETVAVAHAAGVRMPDVDLIDASFALGEAMSNAVSSMAQDISQGRRTEIDALNGYVARRGAELGVATPVNQTLCALVKLFEESIVESGAL